MNEKLHSKLTLNPFRLPIHLGCEAWERESTQPVDFQITFGFCSPLKAEKTDDLEDSICYAKVCDLVSKLTTETHFKLIEKLAEDVRVTVGENFPSHDYLKVSVHKLKPPIDLLTNGVVYECGDFFL